MGGWNIQIPNGGLMSFYTAGPLKGVITLGWNPYKNEDLQFFIGIKFTKIEEHFANYWEQESQMHIQKWIQTIF